MNGQDVLAREIGEDINALQHGEGSKACKVHADMARAVIRVIRISESSSKMVRLTFWLVFVNLLVTTAKSDAAGKLLQFAVSMVIKP